MDPRYIAQVAHAACRAHAAIQGEPPRPERTALIHQVREYAGDPEATAEEHHATFCSRRHADGWIYGQTFDRALRQDPLLRRWAELHRFTRAQDELVLGIVRALAAGAR